jgi:uncharacterized protein YukE
MAGIKVDSGWITDYARTVEQAGDDLTHALDDLRGTPLGSAAFGDVGKQLGTAQAYHRASTTLQQQLSRAADALTAAADNLRKVASQHSTSDADAAAALRAVRRDSGAART